MATHRAHRVAGEIKKEIAQIVREEAKDPRIGTLTITDVEVTNDLRHANIYISTLGQKDIEGCKQALGKASGYIRSELAKRIRLRYAPELHFKLDDSQTYGEKINKLLDKVKGEDNEK
ncbi:ribosome-binding factor A [Desulfitispora alkaliphila]|uniref:30S ribosome-binding factor RbfA n=1 Tax=Desulfitispora alkaliphila TaxID=622674 RepID=UPI003D1C2B48